MHAFKLNRILRGLFGLLGLLIGLNAYAGNPEETCDLDYVLTLNSSLQYCYNDRNDINLGLDLENVSSDSLNNAFLSWSVNGGVSNSLTIGDVIEPSGLIGLSLPTLFFPNEGSYNVTIWVTKTCNGNVLNGDSVNVVVTIRPPFIVNLPENTTKCTGILMPIGVPTGFDKYEWSTGDSVNSITVNETGLYFVTVTDAFGCTAVDSIQIDNFAAPGGLGGSTDTVLCDGDILTVDVGAGFTDYIWSNGMVSSSIQITEPGLYSVVVNDTNGCIYRDSINVQRAQSPTPGTPSILSVCAGDTAIVGAAPTFASYYWSTGDTTNSIAIYSSGVYMITVVGAFGCVGIDTITVSVTPLPTVSFSDSVMCNKTPYVMDIGQWFPSVQWSTGDTTQNILVSTVGPYVVSVTDLNGCHSSDTINVVNIDVDVDLGLDRVTCVGSGMGLFAQGNFDTYLWSDGSTNYFTSVVASGTYSVTVTKGVCYSVDDVVVVVEDEPIADFTAVVSSPVVQFTNTSNTTSNVVWSFGDNDSSTAVSPSHQYAGNGTYTVVLEVSNSCGTKSKSMDVGIFPQATGNIYVNYDLVVFPTLTTTQINFSIDIKNRKEIEYSVYDAVGKLLYHEEEGYFGPDYLYQVNVSRFASGTYFLHIASDNEYIAVEPFVKQ